MTLDSTLTNVFASSLPFWVERHYFGDSKSTSTDHIEVVEERTYDGQQTRTDKGLLAVTKRILNSAEMRAIRLRDKKFRDFLSANSTPWRRGLFLVANAQIRTVGDEAMIWEAERGQLADAAAAALPRMIEEMRVPLGAVFNRDDYPTPETFRDKFFVEYRFVDYGVARQLEEHQSLLHREMRRVQREAQAAEVAIQTHLRTSALAIVTHLRDLLEPTSEGSRRKQLRGNCLSDLVTFLRTFSAQNIVGDTQLASVVERLDDVNRTLDLEILREDDDARARAHQAMAAVHVQLDALVEDQPERQLFVRDREPVVVEEVAEAHEPEAVAASA